MGRHNAVLGCVARRVPRVQGTLVRVNQGVAGVDGIPDLVVVSEVGRSFHIVDVVLPFENRYEAKVEARRLNF